MDGLAIAASLVEVRRVAEGALVRSIHEPEPGTFVLGVFGDGGHSLLVSPRHADIHRTERPFRNPERPSSFVMQLRKHLRGARIRSIRQAGWERVVLVDASRVEAGERHDTLLVAELTGLRGNLLLLDGSRTVVGALRRDPRNPVGGPYTPVSDQRRRDPRTVTPEVLAELVAEDAPARALARGIDGMGRRTAEDVVAFAAARGGADDPVGIREALDLVVACVEAPRPHVVPALGVALFYPPPATAEVGAMPVPSFGNALDETLASRTHPARGAGEPADVVPARVARDRVLAAIGRAARTERALTQWLAAAASADVFRQRANFLLLHAADLGRGTIAVAGADPETGEPLAFAVAPRLSGMENAQALFRKARKLDRGRPTVAARLAHLRAELSRLREALESVDAGDELDPQFLASIDPRRRAAPASTPPASGPRRVEVEGHTILVGRNASQNDALLRRAQPDDLWLHARDVAGSHVLVLRGTNAEIPATVVLEAARLAARHSKADRRGKVAVTCAEARHVRKPKRGAPGLAIVSHESTLTVDLGGGP